MIENSTSQQAVINVPADAESKTLHVLLEVTDHGQPSLTRYRRVVLTGK